MSERFCLRSMKEDFIYCPEKMTFSFYQICQFARNKKYKIRKLIYNEHGELIKHSVAELEKPILDKFLNKCPDFKCSLYPTYDLDVVGFPEANEILTAKSRILNNY